MQVTDTTSAKCVKDRKICYRVGTGTKRAYSLYHRDSERQAQPVGWSAFAAVPGPFQWRPPALGSARRQSRPRSHGFLRNEGPPAAGRKLLLLPRRPAATLFSQSRFPRGPLEGRPSRVRPGSRRPGTEPHHPGRPPPGAEDAPGAHAGRCRDRSSGELGPDGSSVARRPGRHRRVRFLRPSDPGALGLPAGCRARSAAR